MNLNSEIIGNREHRKCLMLCWLQLCFTLFNLLLVKKVSRSVELLPYYLNCWLLASKKPGERKRRTFFSLFFCCYSSSRPKDPKHRFWFQELHHHIKKTLELHKNGVGEQGDGRALLWHPPRSLQQHGSSFPCLRSGSTVIPLIFYFFNKYFLLILYTLFCKW